ncbi:MAG: hypothetical protein LKF53_02950 [Solobacterium sp.]|jgi:hypothetical protein|nr:hypothetical protein [Solobacterium sp.]MCH4205337.1 hypothetical protein [Solobacterium sp.]MCH4226966.1 hypothetical protein [Solobacterium sp.]MCH4282242.1 hypothetical protein [Solobacterium sp.]
MTDFLNGDLKKIYLKYLAASFGSTLWWAMPITELCTAVFAVAMMKKMDRSFAR